MKIESEDIDVRNLLSGRYFHIPRFQRPFSWESEHISQFWGDLNDNQGEDYFIGSMVLYRKGKQDFGVVDGQQRLTTITILLCAIRDHFKSIGEMNLAQGLHNLIENKNIDNENTFVLKTETSFPYFQDEIQSFEDSLLETEPGPEEENLAKAYEQLENYLNQLEMSVEIDSTVSADRKREEKIKRLKSLRDSLLNLKTIKITLENEDDAYVIFETLNTRGKDLALSDLVKNHFTKLIKKKGDLDVVKEKWSKVMEVFQVSQADINADLFISHFWASRYELLPQRSIFPAFKKMVVKDNALDFLNGLRLCENTQMWYASCATGVPLCQVSLKGLIGIRRRCFRIVWMTGSTRIT